MLYQIYTGSYMNENGGDGIYLLEFDTERQTLRQICSYPEESSNPSFLAVTPERVFAVSELDECGYITSFARDLATGELTKLDRLRTEGSAMCHLCLWPDGQHLSAANYMSGSLVVCRVQADGSLGPVCDFKQHYGIGFDSKDRQEGPHVHSTGVSGDGKRLYAADLGLDQIFCYEISEGGRLTEKNEEYQIRTPKGTGPRHFLFREEDRYLYLVTEMGNRLFVYEKAEGEPVYREIQNISTLPEGYTGFNAAADLHFSRDGKFLYVSNRGANNLAVFRVTENGTVLLTGHYDCGGDFPRNFCITPDDRFVVAANQKSGSVAVFARDAVTGAIGGKVSELAIPNAVFVQAVPKGETWK